MGVRRSAVTCAICVFASVQSAAADDPVGLTDATDSDGLGPSYLWDGGALPFIWAPLAGRILLDAYGKPRATPLGFDPNEGGAEPSDWQVPGWGITALGGVSALGMIAGGDDSRYFHVKGLTQALSTGVLVTGLIKVAVGRHRPDWDPDINTDGSRRSFPSGHTTQAFAIATYTILYLHGHVFDDDDGVSAGEAAAYGTIALGAFALAGERVYNNRHHLTDVTVGGLLGSATSTLFYLYQNGRFRNHERARNSQVMVTPTGGGASVGITMSW